MVLACQVTAPSAAIFFRVGISLSATTEGLAPSMLTMKTCSARGAANIRVGTRQRMAGNFMAEVNVERGRDLATGMVGLQRNA